MPDVHVRTRVPSGPLPSFLPLPLPLQPSEFKHPDWGWNLCLLNSCARRHFGLDHDSDGFNSSVEQQKLRNACQPCNWPKAIELGSYQLQLSIIGGVGPTGTDSENTEPRHLGTAGDKVGTTV